MPSTADIRAPERSRRARRRYHRPVQSMTFERAVASTVDRLRSGMDVRVPGDLALAAEGVAS
jgi:hypothetical protein